MSKNVVREEFLSTIDFSVKKFKVTILDYITDIFKEIMEENHFEEKSNIVIAEDCYIDKYGTYIVKLYGGNNGWSDWVAYLNHLSELISILIKDERILKVWLTDMNIDNLDDVWEVELGVRINDEWVSDDILTDKVSIYEELSNRWLEYYERFSKLFQQYPYEYGFIHQAKQGIEKFEEYCDKARIALNDTQTTE